MSIADASLETRALIQKTGCSNKWSLSTRQSLHEVVVSREYIPPIPKAVFVTSDERYHVIFRLVYHYGRRLTMALSYWPGIILRAVGTEAGLGCECEAQTRGSGSGSG